MFSYKKEHAKVKSSQPEKKKRILPSPPSCKEIMTQTGDSSTGGVPENVSDWLIKSSFDNKKQPPEITLSKTDGPQSKSLYHLKPNQKQLRSHSTSHVRIVVDEPLVEINMNSNARSCSYTGCTNSIANGYLSDLSLSAHSNMITPFYKTSPSDLIQKILIYKDPKELSNYKHNPSGTSSLTDKLKFEANPRRPSVTLGMQISGLMIHIRLI